MIIFAFSNKTSKKIPQIICKKYKHVAPIVTKGDKLTMYQFIKYGHVEIINLRSRDLKILQSHGWKFIYLTDASQPDDFNLHNAITCVHMAKKIIKMQNIFIQTPLALYKKLKNDT